MAATQHGLVDGLLIYIRFASENRYRIGAAVAAALAVGLAFLWITPPHFSATASILIEPRQSQSLERKPIITDPVVDTLMLESQVEIIRTGGVSKRVVRDLRLHTDPEFTTLPILTRIKGATSESRSREALERRANNQLQRSITIRRSGLSYIVEITARSRDGRRAAQIANAIADAYIVEQLEARQHAARNASAWLEDRIRQLADDAAEAEQHIAQFRVKHQLVKSDGRAIHEEQLVGSNSQVLAAQARTAQASANLQTAEQAMNSGELEFSATTALKSETLSLLRQQRVDLKRRQAALIQRFGSEHPASEQLLAQIQRSDLEIKAELESLVSNLRRDFETAKIHQQLLEEKLRKSIEQTHTVSESQSHLSKMEARAQAYRELYEAFLQKYMDAIQQQTYPISDARIISRAEPPLSSYYPNTGFVLALATIIGLAFGAGWGVFRAGFGGSRLAQTEQSAN